jgi:hypothetical protein
MKDTDWKNDGVYSFESKLIQILDKPKIISDWYWILKLKKYFFLLIKNEYTSFLQIFIKKIWNTNNHLWLLLLHIFKKMYVEVYYNIIMPFIFIY